MDVSGHAVAVATLATLAAIACGGRAAAPASHTSARPAEASPTASAVDAGAARGLDASLYCEVVRAHAAELATRVDAVIARGARRPAAELRRELEPALDEAARARGVSATEIEAFAAREPGARARCAPPSVALDDAVARALGHFAARELAFRDDPDAALDEARRARRPVVIVICADWAPECAEARRALGRADEASALQRAVRVWADVTDDQSPDAAATLRRFRVDGVPTVVVLDPGGREVGRVTKSVALDRVERLVSAAR